MASRRAEVHIQGPHALKEFNAAPTAARKALRTKARGLALDPQGGTYIALGGVPKRTRKAWEMRVGPVSNLYKVDLPGAWRGLYTIGSDGPLRVVLFLSIVDHGQYDRLLGYG